MLAGGGRAWQIGKRPSPTTYRNAERQEVLPPPASDCHSLREWLSSPTRMVPTCCFAAEYHVFSKRWREKWRAGLSAGFGRGWHMASFEGCRNTPPARLQEFDWRDVRAAESADLSSLAAMINDSFHPLRGRSPSRQLCESNATSFC